jgi:integrase
MYGVRPLQRMTGTVHRVSPRTRTLKTRPDVRQVGSGLGPSRRLDALARLKGREHFTGDDDLVFASEVGEHLDHYKLRRCYYEALDRAGLRRIRFHDLRHAFGTAAISKLDPYAVQSYMGHQHYSTTQRYLHHKPRSEDATKLSEAFGSENGAVSRSQSGTERSTDTPISNGHKGTNQHVTRHKPTPQTG